MDAQWQQGWQDGYNNASVNSGLTILYKTVDGKKVYSSHGGGAKFPETFGRSGVYDSGYAEGMISGFSAYATNEKIKSACEKMGVIYE